MLPRSLNSSTTSSRLVGGVFGRSGDGVNQAGLTNIRIAQLNTLHHSTAIAGIEDELSCWSSCIDEEVSMGEEVDQLEVSGEKVGPFKL